MKDNLNLATALQIAHLHPHDPAAISAYQDAELLRQRGPLWQALHRVHPTLPQQMNIIGFGLLYMGLFTLIFLVVTLSPTAPTIRLSPTAFVTAILGTLFLTLAGFLFASSHNRGKRLRWEFRSIDLYEKLYGPMPPEGYAMISRIRAVTDVGDFQVKVVGNDPILNYSEHREEFDPRGESYDMLVWGPNGTIIDLPRL